MMIPKNLQSLTRVFSHLRYGQHLEPARDWIVLLILFVVALIVSVIWNIALFFKTVNNVEMNAGGVPVAATSSDPVGAVQDIFSTRASEELRYQSEYHFVDPSR